MNQIENREFLSRILITCRSPYMQSAHLLQRLRPVISLSDSTVRNILHSKELITLGINSKESRSLACIRSLRVIYIHSVYNETVAVDTFNHVIEACFPYTVLLLYKSCRFVPRKVTSNCYAVCLRSIDLEHY